MTCHFTENGARPSGLICSAYDAPHWYAAPPGEEGGRARIDVRALPYDVSVSITHISLPISSSGGADAADTKVGKKSLQGRDLLSLLVRANMAHDLPPSQRLSDDDVLARAL